MLFVCISDTHMKHANTDFEHRIRTASKLGNPSVLVHCGDFSNDGSDQEIEKFVQWLQWIKGFDYKLVIAGNHDKGLYSKKRKAKCLAFFNRAQKQECEKGKLIYLEDKMIEIEDVKIYGCAYPNPSKSSNDWSFNPYGHIQNCDILLTHIPPYGILDQTVHEKHIGSENLRIKVVEIQPKVHIFGHVHESAGLLKQDDIQFINASSVDKDKEFTNPLICFNYSVESGFELLNV